MDKEFGNRLKMIRKQKGLMVKEVAFDTGIPFGTIAAYEHNGCVGKKRLIVLEQYYNVKLERRSKS